MINKIRNTPVPYQFKLVSFDVWSLFTNVSLKDTITFLQEALPSSLDGLKKSQILKLIELCFSNNKITFEGTTFQQGLGVAMGNALSPVVGNLYKEFYELKLLPKVLPSHVPWFRYVDDVLCLFPQNMN